MNAATLAINDGGGKNFSNCPQSVSSAASSLSSAAKTATSSASSYVNTTTTSSASISTSTSNPHQNSVNIGAVAGGVAGGVVIVLLLAGAIFFFCWKKAKRNAREMERLDMIQHVEPEPFMPHQQRLDLDSSSYSRGIVFFFLSFTYLEFHLRP
jgi:hypothetical protein